MKLPEPDDYRWPSKGDRLLRAEGDWERTVTFSDHELGRHAELWDGYIRAGAALIEQREESDNPLDRADLVYPILFCYRHSLELAMKWIIERYGRHARVSAPDFRHHDLWELWEACRKIILEVGSDEEDDAFRTVEQIVRDFHELDKGSFSFRYPTDKKGAIIRLPDAAPDMTHVRKVMEAVNNFFEGADGQLDDNVSAVGW